MLTSPAAADREGRLLGGCRLRGRLSASALGEVYLAEQLSLGNRLVAVKVVPTWVAAADETTVPAAAQRFMHEAEVLAHFAHPHIITVHDSGVADDVLYLVMQYVPEGSLADVIGGKGHLHPALPAPPRQTAALVGQLASALHYTHGHGIVHRDVKPSNVLVQVHSDGRWHLLLADFGIARELQRTADLQHVIGTLPYMAPEQFDGRSSPASDQYALGVLTYLLLAGRTPFRGSAAEVLHAHQSVSVPDLRQFNPTVPQAVSDVVTRALAKHPADRWPSVTAFSQALSLAANGAPDAADDAGAPDAPDGVALLPAGTPKLATIPATGSARDAMEAPALLAAADDALEPMSAAAGTQGIPIADTATLGPDQTPMRQTPVDEQVHAVRRRPLLLLTLFAALLLAALTLVAPQVFFAGGQGAKPGPTAPTAHPQHVVPTHAGMPGSSRPPGGAPSMAPTARPATRPTPQSTPAARPLASPTPTQVPTAAATPQPTAIPTATPAPAATPTPAVPTAGTATPGTGATSSAPAPLPTSSVHP